MSYRLYQGTPSPSYERLISRVRSLVTAPRALVEKQVDLAPRHGELPEDWELLIDQIRNYETVSLTTRPDGSIHIRWRAALA